MAGREQLTVHRVDEDHAPLTPTFPRLAPLEVTPGARVLDRDAFVVAAARAAAARAYLSAASLRERWAREGPAGALRAALAAGCRTLTIRSTLLFKLRRP